jgi:enoyl-CoA hydratase/carnithine racemase
MTSNVVLDRQDAVLRLTIDRVEKKNALTDAIYADLAHGLKTAATDPDIRVALITGAGNVFTAGNDIADFAAVAAGLADIADRNVHAFLAGLAGFPKPLVAAVPGLAVGIGTTMLLHCDYVLVAESARLSVPFVNLATVPEAGSSLLLPARIGHPRAFAMFALGEAIDAATALDWGLANKVVPDDRLAEAAMEVAAALATRPAAALQATKRLMRDEQAVAARMAAEMESFAACLKTPEARAAFEAFAARRRS